uniref:Putative ovule protein n=1 Tax=Solanum chacoense TaxID=4108 RepID=A0A0V0I7J7_SOLCH
MIRKFFRNRLDIKKFPDFIMLKMGFKDRRQKWIKFEYNSQNLSPSEWQSVWFFCNSRGLR